jgi:hypothetical protein
MTHVDTGITGAKRQSWKHDNPRDVLKNILEQNARAAKEELLEIFTRTMFEKGNRALIETVIEYWFANNLNSLLNSDSRLKGQFSKPQQVTKIKDQIRERIKIAAGVVLMDMIMPNKKRLRDCSGAECAAVGGWLSVVSARMSPSAIVGKTFSEQDIRSMLAEIAKVTDVPGV